MDRPQRSGEDPEAELPLSLPRQQRQQSQVGKVRCERGGAEGKRIESEPTVKQVEEQPFRERAESSLRPRLDHACPEFIGGQANQGEQSESRSV